MEDTGTVPYSQLLLKLADSTDKMFMAVGFTTAILCGLGLPSFVFLFGDIADSFADQDVDTTLS
jgi:isocitrate dehydrogenase kinase/phosphatase